MAEIVSWWTDGDGSDRSTTYHECAVKPAAHKDRRCVCSCGASRAMEPKPCPNTECQDGGVLVDSMLLYGVPGGEDWAACETCGGVGVIHG